jgi:hypothetical protein
VGRVLPTAFVLALVAGSLGALALTQRAKTEPSPLVAVRADGVFSPDCGCPQQMAKIDLELRTRERLEVWMERAGRRVATVVGGRTFAPGRVPLGFLGVTDEGIALPDGAYAPVVHLGLSHRTIRLPYRIRIDTRPPTIEVRKTPMAVISPDGDGHADSFRTPYRLEEPARAILLANDRRAFAARRPTRTGTFVWDGRRAGRGPRPGIYVLEATARDDAGNVAKPYPVAVVNVRYVVLGRPRVIARPGGRIAIRVSTDAPTVEWRLNGRTGTARRGTLILRAPRRPGFYRLFVTAAGHAAKAAVVVA